MKIIYVKNDGDSLLEMLGNSLTTKHRTDRVCVARASKFDAKSHIPLERGDALSEIFPCICSLYSIFRTRVWDFFARSIAAVSIGESRAFHELFRSELHACGRRVKCSIIRDL